MIIINNSLSNRRKDDNGFLYVDNNLILSEGVMEYAGSELMPYTDDGKIEGEIIDPNKIYKLNISLDELKKCMDLWANKPVINDHTWVGKGGESSKGLQEGNIGEQIELIEKDSKNFIKANITFTNLETIELIEDGDKVGLSTSYTNDVKKSTNNDYDFEVINIKPNHLALVDNPRGGNRIRVANSDNTNINNKEKEKMKLKNNIKLVVDDKEIDLSEFIKEEANEGGHDSIQSGNEEEGKDKATCNEDKRKIIDEVGGMIKDKVDEELWKTIIGKLEKLSYEGSEKTKTDNKELEVEEDKNKDKPTEEKPQTMNSSMINSLISKAKNDFKEEQQGIIKAYNSVKAKVGDFDFSEMDEKGIYKYALQNSGIELEGNEGLEALKTAFKVYNSQDRVEIFNSDAVKNIIPSHIK